MNLIVSGYGIKSVLLDVKYRMVRLVIDERSKSIGEGETEEDADGRC
jgi:hypothetical protein